MGGVRAAGFGHQLCLINFLVLLGLDFSLLQCGQHAVSPPQAALLAITMSEALQLSRMQICDFYFLLSLSHQLQFHNLSQPTLSPPFLHVQSSPL